MVRRNRTSGVIGPSIGSSNVTGQFVKISTPKAGADYYLEIGF